jgi:DNA-binding transcriptional LysR family regulator
MHAGGMLVRKLLPAWLRRLERARPDLAIDLHEAEEPALPLLLAGATDLVVDYLPVVPPDVTAVGIGATHGFIVIHASHPLARRSQWPLAEIRETFIT